MATARSEDQIFFLYDHGALQKEEDDLKDAIKYFFPSSISVDDQCALCGQLMGMVEYFQNFLGKTPKLFKLQKNKIAVKHLGKYTLALAGNLQEPDNVLIRQLDSLYGLFVFYQGGMDLLNDRCQLESRDFMGVLQSIWDCYLPFIRKYGDSLAASFESIPAVELPKHLSSLFLQASHLLQYTGKQTGVLAGCLLYKGRVLCTQLPPVVTSRILIIRPKQAHFPCRQIIPNFQAPAGVRILSVHLTAKEYSELNIDTKYEGKQPAPSRSSQTHRQNAEDDANEILSCSTSPPGVQEHCVPETTSSNAEGSNGADESPPGKSESPSGSTGDCLVQAVEQVQIAGPADHCDIEIRINEGEGPISSADGQTVEQESDGIASSKSSGGASGIGQEAAVTETTETEEDINEKAEKNECSQQSTNIKSENTENADLKLEDSGVKEQQSGGSPAKTKRKSDTSTLFQNLKKVAAQNSNVLENITRQMEMENGFDSDDDDNDIAGISSILADLKNDTEAYVQKETYLNTGEQIKEETSPKKQQNGKTHFSHRMVLKSPQRDKRSPDAEEPVQSPEKRTQNDEPSSLPDNVNTTAPSLVNLDLFVQGNSDIVLLLLMEKGSANDCDTIRKLWKTTLQQLGELESQLKTNNIIDNKPSQEHQMAGYNYLTYDSFMKSLAGNMLRPMSSNENDFCDTAILMKDEFEGSAQLIDLTLRSHTTSVYGHKNGSQQVYFQPKDGKPQPGIPSARDPNIGLDSKAYIHLLQDQNIHVI